MSSVPNLPDHVPVAVATRGSAVEAVHYGSIVVADADGKVLACCGDTQACVFPRSAVKPFQAMPLIAHKDFARYGFTQREIALCCASHSGEPRHAETVVEMLRKIGCDKPHLLCGVQPPLYLETMGVRVHADDIFTAVHHNCSGKHTGMLALARLLEAPTNHYVEATHPVQRAIFDAIAWFSGVPRDELVVGVDGCSAPAVAVPLAALARAFARLVDTAPDARYGAAPQTIVEAMAAHPEMVSGVKRIDLALAHAGRGDWIPKRGAEAVQAIGIRSGRIGIAIKIADGAPRALHVVTVEVLRQLGLVGDLTDTPLESWARAGISNWRDQPTGEVLPIVNLEFTAAPPASGDVAAP